MSDNAVEDWSILNWRYDWVMDNVGPLDVLFVVVSLRMLVWYGGGGIWVLEAGFKYGLLGGSPNDILLTQIEGDQIYQAQAGRHLHVFAPSLSTSFWDSLLPMC
jgi:hypothetical protein